MSFVYHHRPAFYGTIRLHDSNGVFAFHTYLLEAKDTWVESDMDIKFTMTANNTTKTLQDYADENSFNIISGDPLSYNGGSHNRGATLAAYQIQLDSGVEVSDLSSLENISVRSGLSAIPTGEEPVEVSLDDQNTKIYTLGRKVQVRINGTLNHDPDQEVLIIRNNRHSYQRESGTGWFNTTMSIAGTYNFGSEIADASLSRTSTPSGVGLIFTGDTGNGSSTDNWNPRNASVTGGGTWKCRGGVIQTNKMINFTGTLNVVGTTFSATHKSGAELEWRNPFGNTSSSFNGTFYKIYIVDPQFQPVLEFKGGGLAEVYGSWWEKEVYNLDLSTNATDVDIGASAGGTHQHHDWHIINSATGSDIKHMWRKTTGNTDIIGNVFVKREVAINIKDGSGVAVEGCQVYVIDNPSSYAKDATFEQNTYSTTPTYSRASITNGYITYNYADAVEYLEETDANGDTPTMKILISTSMHNARPNADPNTIPDAFPTWAGSTFANYASNFNGGKWQESDGSRVAYSDWDTDRFGGYFKVDRRGNDNTNADLFTFKFCSYGHNLAATTTTLKGLNALQIDWTLFDDLLITEPRAKVDDYSTIDTPEEFYNKAKAYLVDNYSGETETIINRQGNTIDAGGYDVTIDANASAVFDLLPALNTNNFPRIRVNSNSPKITPFGELEMYASYVSELNGTYYPQYTTAELNADLERFFLRTELDPNDSTKVRWYLIKNTALWTRIAESESSATMPIHPYDNNISWKDDQANLMYPLDVTQMQSAIAIKASSFIGNITTTGTVSLNDVDYTGTITDSTGVRSFGSFEVKNLLSGSRVQVYNVTKNAEIYNDIVNDTSLTRGFSTDEMVNGDSIRVRIAYQDGSNAREPQEFSVTCRTPFWDVTASQENATQYNSYQVDGSGISEFTLDLANGKIEVDISDSDNSTNIQRVGAWYYSQLMTSDGIANLFGAINWIAGNQISIDQSKVNLQLDNKKSEPLVLTGGRLYRLDETTIIAPTSNSIQIDYSPIYITNAPLIEDINKNTKLIPALL